MPALNERMKEIFGKQGIFALATADLNGVPNVVPVGAVKILDDETILISDQYLHKTLENLRQNPKVAISFWERAEGEGYQIKGEATIHTQGEIYEETAEWIRRRSEEIVDISERKSAEEALRKSAEELKRSNAELEQFAYVASHDLQEPLRMIIGFLQLLEQRDTGKLEEKQKTYIEYAVSGASRMSQLINDLLEYSRVQRKARTAERIDLNQALDHALFNLQKSLEESGTTVTRDALPELRGDQTQLTQLFQNLIGNAVKFRREGVRPEVTVSCRRNGNDWVISVSDNGIGIAAEHVDRIFMIFQRLHSRKEYPGTGIGLAICKKIVEQHGGTIQVESELGTGSTFHCRFPA